jgi:hypothetical protein
MFWNKSPKQALEVPPGPSREQSLAMRPARGAGVREEPLGQAGLRLVYPVVVKPWFVGLAKRLGAGQGGTITRTLELDELGSFCWGLVDGQRDVREMARLMAERYGLPRREAELAVAAFLRELGRRGLLGFKAG